MQMPGGRAHQSEKRRMPGGPWEPQPHAADPPDAGEQAEPPSSEQRGGECSEVHLSEGCSGAYLLTSGLSATSESWHHLLWPERTILELPPAVLSGEAACFKHTVAMSGWDFEAFLAKNKPPGKPPKRKRSSALALGVASALSRGSWSPALTEP